MLLRYVICFVMCANIIDKKESGQIVRLKKF